MKRAWSGEMVSALVTVAILFCAGGKRDPLSGCPVSVFRDCQTTLGTQQERSLAL